MAKTVEIASRFKGPPNSGNGGYTCGLLGLALGGVAETSLRIPPPLDTPLDLLATDEGAELRMGDTLVGTAKPATLDLEVPALPDPFELGVSPVGGDGQPFAFEPFSTCFVCGHDRTPGDGLCIYAKKLIGHDGMVGDYWTLDAGLAGADGNVDPVFIWAALDCPGYFACTPGKAALLARLTAEIIRPLKAEGKAKVIGWDLGSSGRKHRCGTAVFDADGNLVAKAEGLWIEIDPNRVKG